MPAPPTGTVTFLFTDIEGSTKLWEQYPDAMPSALARHDGLLRQSIEDNGGYIVKTTGDGVHAAFATAPDAIAAVLNAQCALQAEPWGQTGPILVRMGLHTGVAEIRDGDYYGGALNRAARLMAAGHGGQVILSAATQELVRDHLPDGASLCDLGRHRLKDLGRSEQVFQLLHPPLPIDFPPLRSLDNPALPNNLPQQLTSFIGRETQVSEVKALLGKTRLLTLTGAGGSGKTRLSLQAAADLLDGEGDGVWLVELAALSDLALVPQVVADVLGVREEAGKPIQRTLVDWLKSKRLLLVLDNCEHLVAACAALAADLLRACPQIHILATSREPLNVAGEQTYRLPSLSLPDPTQKQTVEVLSQYEAVRLFLERAQTVQPLFTITNASAPAVAQICWRLDGIPLAIELAAARVRSLPVEEINTRLDNRFHLLTGGARNTLPRQQTLRALIDWSYDLLTEAEKTLLRRLSVFAGGWTLAAAEGVCSDEERETWEVLDLLTSLVDKSLVMYEEVGRYRLLETVRQYAGDRLGESGASEEVHGRAASWFLALAEEAEPQMMGPGQAIWLERLEMEHDNLRASLSWYEKSAVGIEAGIRLAGALWRFWWAHGHLFEGRHWLGKALGRTSGQKGAAGLEASAARGKALNGAGLLSLYQGDYAGARALYEESLAIGQQSGNRQGIAISLGNLGGLSYYQGDYATARALCEEGLAIERQLGNRRSIVYSLNHMGNLALRQGDCPAARALYEESLAIGRQSGDQQGIAISLGNMGFLTAFQGDYAIARALHEESLAIGRQLGDQQGIAYSLNHMGNLALRQGDCPAARALHEESLTLFRQLGNQWGIANSLGSLGNAALGQGDYPAARALHEESLTLFRQLGNHLGIVFSLNYLGNVALRQGDYPAAQNLYEESLAIGQQSGNQMGIAENLEGLAGVAYGLNQVGRAAELWGAASSLRDAIGGPLPPAAQEEMDKRISSGRTALGEDAFAAAWAAGRAMTPEQAVKYALDRPRQSNDEG